MMIEIILSAIGAGAGIIAVSLILQIPRTLSEQRKYNAIRRMMEKADD